MTTLSWLWELSACRHLNGKSQEELTILGFHVSQVTNMGCGVACLMMVMRWAGIDFEIVDHIPMPAWTIDLYIYLREANLDATMHTLVAGMNPDNIHLDWYAQHMSSAADVARCNEQFASARTKGWEVEQRATTLAEVSSRVAQQDTISICLVDGNLLNQQNSSSFAGHFIVLVHFEESTGCFWTLDPAQQRDPCIRIFNKSQLEKARTAAGTDEDIIFIKSNTSRKDK